MMMVNICQNLSNVDREKAEPETKGLTCKNMVHMAHIMLIYTD